MTDRVCAISVCEMGDVSNAALDSRLLLLGILICRMSLKIDILIDGLFPDRRPNGWKIRQF